MKERRMTKEAFNSLLDELDGNSLKTLKEKNARYSRNNDSLHNFRAGASITGKTPAETCWGYASKHFIALRDMVDANDFSNREDFLEKCQDAINYIRFLWCIGNDEEYWQDQERPKACESSIGSPERMWDDITVTNVHTGESFRYDFGFDSVLEETSKGFIVHYRDVNGDEGSRLYDWDNYTYKINNRKDK